VILSWVLREGAKHGAARATLEVRRSNAAALKLYERLGFKVGGTRRNYYTSPVEDALILWLEPLPSPLPDVSRGAP
jgi:ribosomal-protein-alanine N-acetyltransferase